MHTQNIIGSLAARLDFLSGAAVQQGPGERHALTDPGRAHLRAEASKLQSYRDSTIASIR